MPNTPEQRKANGAAVAALRRWKKDKLMKKPEIETAVPAPEPREPRYAWPFAELQAGQSFFVEDVKGSTVHTLTSRAAKKLGCKFTVRKEGTGYRVWRV